MKFKFKLEAVKKHRKILKDLAQKDFELARLAVDQKLAQINMMYDAIDNARLMADEMHASDNVKSAPFLQIEDFILGQTVRIQMARVEVRGLMAVMEEKQEILVEKAKEHKVLEKLEEKKFAEFKKEVSKKQQIAADDMSIMRFRRDKESA
jgi:flagellar export protein FliJ